MSNQNEFDLENIPVADGSIESKTNAELAAELQALELEEKKLDLEIKRETVAKIKSQRAAKLEEARAKLIATRQFLAQREANQNACNHRKGGIGADAVMRGQGTDAMYAVIKHKLPDGRYFILCQRCGKEWHPGNVKLGMIETPGYQEAIRYNTNNTASGSSSFLFEQTGA